MSAFKNRALNRRRTSLTSSKMGTLSCPERIDLTNEDEDICIVSQDSMDGSSQDDFVPAGSPNLSVNVEEEEGTNRLKRKSAVPQVSETLKRRKNPASFSDFFGRIGSNGFIDSISIRGVGGRPRLEDIYVYLVVNNNITADMLSYDCISSVELDAPEGGDSAVLYFINRNGHLMGLNTNRVATDIALNYSMRTVCSADNLHERASNLPVTGRAFIWTGNRRLSEPEWKTYLHYISTMRPSIKMVLFPQNGDCIKICVPEVHRRLTEESISDPLLSCVELLVRLNSTVKDHRDLEDLTSYSPTVFMLDRDNQIFCIYFRCQDVLPMRFQALEKFSRTSGDGGFTLETDMPVVAFRLANNTVMDLRPHDLKCVMESRLPGDLVADVDLIGTTLELQTRGDSYIIDNTPQENTTFESEECSTPVSSFMLNLFESNLFLPHQKRT